jgi:hypothetical protein
MEQQPASGPQVPAVADSTYHLAPAFGLRFVGGLLVLLAIALVVATVVVAVAGLPVGVLVAVALGGIVAVLGGGWLVTRRVPAVRLDASGYRVRLVRGVGATSAPWTEVTEAGTASPAGTPVLVISLRDGRSTTIPVQVLAADRELLVRDLRAHLDAGHGLRPL